MRRLWSQRIARVATNSRVVGGPIGMPAAEEAALIAESSAAISKHEGQAPRGWLSPWIAESRTTPDMLVEAGYRYTLNWCMDDAPIWMHTRAGKLLAIPYPQEVNDIPSIVARGYDY